MIETSLKGQAARISRRKAELGYSGFDYVARNPGGRRTPSKQALLAKPEETARERGEKPPFKTNG